MEVTDRKYQYLSSAVASRYDIKKVDQSTRDASNDAPQTRLVAMYGQAGLDLCIYGDLKRVWGEEEISPSSGVIDIFVMPRGVAEFENTVSLIGCR